MKNKKDNLSRRGFMKFVGNLGGGVVASKLSSKILTSKVLVKKILSSNAIKTLGLSLPFGAAFIPSRSEANTIRSFLIEMDNFSMDNWEDRPAQLQSNTLKFKGNLRISWNFDIAYNKNIDLIFFTEENPYLKYAVLYANDFKKKLYEKFAIGNMLDGYEIPHNINYDFVKEILGKSELSEYQQKKFLDSRFGSVFVPMEIEFEWYISYQWDGNSSFLDYDEFLKGDTDEIMSFYYCLGIIKSHKILPKNTKLNLEEMLEYEYHSYMCADIKRDYEWSQRKTLPYSATLFNPLPNTALAITKTNKLGDYVINVRDTPDTKDSKIIAQLFTQDFSWVSMSNIDENIIEQGRIMSKEDGMHYNDERDWMLYYNHKAQKAYYKANKSKLINPQWEDKYLVFIQKILPNNWCKVLVLKVPDGLLDTLTTKAFGTQTASSLQEWHGSPFPYNTKKCKAYMDKFYNQISTITLADGYIHSSGLDYLAPFPRD